MSSEAEPLLAPQSRTSYSLLDNSGRQQDRNTHHVSLDVQSAQADDGRRALPTELFPPSASSSSSRQQPDTVHISPRRLPPPPPPPPRRIPPRPVSLTECCSGCTLTFARFIGSCRWLWLSSSLYFLCHIAVSLYTLLTYFTEHCTYDYHYLLLVYCLRSLLALRIVWWQTHEDEAAGGQAAEPGTFDRFLKNWMDMIALIYAGMWSLAPRDCLDTAPHQFTVCTAFVALSYTALAVRLLLYLALTHCPLPDTLFILLRSLQKNLNAGSAFTGQLTEATGPVRMSEVRGVRRVVWEGVGVGEGGGWDEEDAMCAICLAKYELGEDIRVLGCSHHMHSRCVDRWVMEKRRCPLCNQHV